MSSSSSKPSIFTSRESFKRPAQPSKGTPPRTNSPLRRQSTPNYLEKNIIRAAAEAAPLAITLPPNNLAQYAIAGENRGIPNERYWSTPPALWTPAEGGQPYYGRASPGSGVRGRSASVSQAATRTPTEERATFITPASAGRKRPTSSLENRAPTSEPSTKKQRVHSKPRGRHLLDTFSFAPPLFEPPLQPPSPLFFSNSPKPRPRLPPRFSSSEAGAKMLSKARTEDSHVKTVSLARGLVTTPSVAPNTFHQQYGVRKGSMDRATAARSNSPDSSHGGKDLTSLLNSIGIIELLEQDGRPTFIIDLGDSLNYGPGSLRVLFCNSSLRSYHGLESVVSGAATGVASPGTQTHLQFKAWVLSASVNGESLNVCLPSFMFASMTWSCSTLRKRLRIISGSYLLSPGTGRLPVIGSSVPPLSSAEPQPLEDMLGAGSTGMREPADYFGTATVSAGKTLHRPGIASDRSSSSATEVMPSIEPHPPTSAKSSPSRNTDMPDVNGILSTPHHDLSGATDLLPSSTTYVLPPASVAAAPESVAPDPPISTDHDDSQINTVSSDAPSFDWTRLPITDNMPNHIRFARSVDWGATSLGPVETWSSDLRQMCNLIMASPHPAAMYWGEDLVAIYNEAYILLAGQKHPKLMGQTYREAWAEIWDEVKDVFVSARTTGEATMKDDDCLFMMRNDFLEECYFSWSIIPMVGQDGSVMGLYNPAFEKTRRKIAERRMLTLREVGERTASARDVKAFWAQVLGSFEFNEYDSPFLLLYSVSDDMDSDSSSIHSSSVISARQCFLEGALGVPEGHQAAPEQIDLRAGKEGLGPVFREVMKTDKPVLLEVGGRDLPPSLLQGLEWRGFGDPVRAMVVCPIHPTTGESILGFLVLGINPRRPYDDDYSLFVQLLSRQLATSLASVVLFEEEIRRGQRAAQLAALDRIELSEQLAARTQEAIESETKFSRMAEFAPVGMFIAGSDGKITFANDTWYETSGVPRNSNMADTWMEAVNPEDHTLVNQLWDDLVRHTKPVSSEFRFRRPWRDRNGTKGDTWALFSAYPEKYDDGRLKSVFGSITNISQQKWAEGIQTRKMEEAVELKRQQENFIDITSHEMRNPLSAILQCSDEIAAGLTGFKKSGEKVLPDELLTSCLDAAQIINLCSQHQKRIVDDILTLSKLDSQLLLVTPVDAQPLTVVQRALKMHEGELVAADIQLKFIVDQSYRDMELDWVRLDPSRVLQVLINLTTNAIKFTGTEKKRTISVTIAASKVRPSERTDAPVEYFESRRKGEEAEDKDWGDGEKVYIHFAVRDTGRGLNPEEKKMLFMRFSQASPRTHVQYGGSGLGLFISRELTELQGGEIGVASQAGKGSTFAFYIVARKSSAPADADTGTGFRRGDVRSKTVPGPSAASSAALKKDIKDLAQSVGITPNGDAAPPAKKDTTRRVLIVEDNLVNQRVLQKQLKNIGTEVHLANHGGEALDKLQQSTYWAGNAGVSGKLKLGVVLMDQEMPVMDGLTCTRKIRELEKEGKLTGHVPIIAVTANARAEQVQTALDAGMDDVVSKPFRIPELVPKIEELLDKYPSPSV